MRKSYDERRRYLIKRLNDIGMPAFEPLGAFYIFPSIKKFKMTSDEFATKLLEKEKLAVVPGTAFGTWVPRTTDAHLAVYAGILPNLLKTGGDVAVCAVLDDDKEHRSNRYECEWNGMLQFSNVMQFGGEYIALSKTGLDQMAYLSLAHEVQEVDINAQTGLSASETDVAWQAIKEMLFDEEAKSFAAAASEMGIPAPAEENIGYEVEGEDGEVVATIEIAWPDKKVGFMTEDQLEDKERLERDGWRVVDMISLSDAIQIFGGEV